MTEPDPTLFDDEMPHEPELPVERNTDLQAIIDEQQRESEAAQQEIERRAAQDAERVKRAREQGIDLTTHQEAQREVNRRGIEKARQRLSEIDPPPEV